MTLKKNEPLLSGNLIREAAKESLKKLSPKAQAKNPVMLIVYLGSIFTGALFMVHLGSPWNAALTFKKKYRSSRKP